MRIEEFEARINELHSERFKAFEGDVIRKNKLMELAHKDEKGRDSRRLEFLKRLGLDARLLDAEEKGDNDYERKALDGFLKQFREPAVERKSLRGLDSKFAAIHAATLAESHYTVLNPFSASIYAASSFALEANPGANGSGAINSGWVFPDDASHIKIKDGGHVGTACFEAYASPPSPTFAIHFCFTPATTATYEMTAVVAFHGFYVLRSNDGLFNCRHSHARLNIRMNANQYVDHGWHDFPALINRSEQNVEEVTHYDQTKFFDYTTALKADDPVVVTVVGTLDALGVGGHTYAELNFEAGSANYIWPLFLSVRQV